jgi:hypothetical protein
VPKSYWVIDVNNHHTLVYLCLIEGAFQETREYSAWDTVLAMAAPNVKVDMSELFA